MIKRTEKVDDLSSYDSSISPAVTRTNAVERAYGGGHGSHTRFDHEGPRRDCESSRVPVISDGPLIDSLFVFLDQVSVEVEDSERYAR
jgi:hypothetical protein